MPEKIDELNQTLMALDQLKAITKRGLKAVRRAYYHGSDGEHVRPFRLAVETYLKEVEQRILDLKAEITVLENTPEVEDETPAT